MKSAVPEQPGPVPVANDPAASPFSDAFHKTIVDNIADGVYYVDRDRKITYWNHGAERLTGYAAVDMVGQFCFANRLSHVDGTGTALCNAGCPLAQTIEDGDVREAEVWLRHETGYRRPVRVRTAPVYGDDGAIVGAVEVFDDASRMLEARREVEVAQHDALTDTLTGLPNRRHFDAALEGRLENLRRYEWSFGLLIADVDHFKSVNDEHGHDMGDTALAVVGATLAGGARSGDLVARWGGEEFTVLVHGAGTDALKTAAERLRILVARSVVRADGVQLRIRISVGGTAATPSDTPATILARADRALYAAKTGGRDRVVIDDTSPAPPTSEGPVPATHQGHSGSRVADLG